MKDVVSHARELARTGQRGDAAALLEKASAAGNRDACAELGLWFLREDIIARDLPRARKFLGQAAALGQEDAILLEIAFSANGTGAQPDWAAAMSLLRRGARDHAYLRDELEIVESLDLDENGFPNSPVNAILVNEELGMLRCPSFLSQRECQHLANVAVSTLQPSSVFDPSTGRQIANLVRTSDGTVIGPAQEDLVVQAVLRRLAKVTGTSVLHGESLSVLRYAPGQEFKPHFDAIPKARNNRVKTVLMYLNDGYGGGQTSFPALGLVIEPRAGDALVFDGVKADGSVHPLSRHAGLPVSRGTKWMATRWIRAKPFDPWTAVRGE